MAGLSFSHLLFVTITYVLLRCGFATQRTLKLVYQPYGPMMCRDLCKNSPDSLFFVLEDLSCNRIEAVNVSGYLPTFNPENNQLGAVTSRTVLAKWDICNNTHIKTESQLGLEQERIGSRGLHLFQKNCGITLHRACEEGRLAVVKYILFNEIADINCRGKQGRTPVMAAVRTGQVSVFDFLVGKGCNMLALDDNHDNVLHIACEVGNIDLVRKLVIGEKINKESRGIHRYTPVLKAVYYGHRKVFDFLVNNDCDLKVYAKLSNNVLHVAIEGGNVDMVKYVVSLNIVDMESKNYRGRNPVMRAARYGYRKVFDFLVSKRCNLKVVDIHGNNILHVACKGGDADVVKYIVSKNIVHIERRNDLRRTPLLVTASYGHRQVFEFLVSKGCNLKVVDKGRNNVLHLASQKGHVDMVRYMISLLGVERMGRVKNKYGRTPIQEAEHHHHTSVVNILKHVT